MNFEVGFGDAISVTTLAFQVFNALKIEEWNKLATVTESCRADLKELEALLAKYDGAASILSASRDKMGEKLKSVPEAFLLNTHFPIGAARHGQDKHLEFSDLEVLIIVFGATGWNGINSNIVDLPRFDDTCRSDLNIIMELADYLETTFRVQFKMLVSFICKACWPPEWEAPRRNN
ncbi:hypothetical protein K432DRAFT_442809 [Lepidopterella palustris CBS 459.81]|uniref:Uncharacterized protein n=1 Tax=Lepidopterella palustris CBS 459.81 TaxID=1314670 RepID=A0A8E2EBD8_9PEZI|nr:hypothetical protein K432DRAFT_442809 [Lepidopterella palustris CBS 459.81]